MSKIPSLTPQEVIKILEKKGFVLDRTKGSHHIYYHPETKRRVVVPLHKKDLPKGTLFEILRQAGINLHKISQTLHHLKFIFVRINLNLPFKIKF
jgi:predicted RNA binding protein YcfA (HicA-like mRNA interferase family)